MLIYQRVPRFSAPSLGYTPYTQYGGVLNHGRSPWRPGSTGSWRWKQYVYGRRGETAEELWCFLGDLR